MVKKFSYQDVKEYIEGFGYKLLTTEYKNCDTKMEMICPNGHTVERTFTNFKHSQRCQVCDNKNIKHTIDYVKDYIKSYGYKLISKEYVNAKEKITVECPEGHKFDIRFCNFKSGYRCPTCGTKSMVEKQRHDYQYVFEYIQNEGYELLSDEYIKAKSKLRIKCPKGHEFTMSFNNFKNHKQRCPICGNKSKGEKQITDILNKYQIKYKTQYKFDDCKLKFKLPFDFYLPDKNMCIEYDGEQHYEIGHFNGDLDDFVTIKIRDTIKTIYCENNNIKLIRIPYWEFNNIEKILLQEII